MAQGNNNLTIKVNSKSYDKQNVANMEWLVDIFDVLNDDDDDDNNEAIENVMEEYNQEFDFDYSETNVDEEEMLIEADCIPTKSDQDNKIGEEKVLSQKLSQLSTEDEKEQEELSASNKKRQLSTPSTPDVAPPKKIRVLDDNEQQKSQIPEYLQATNKFFNTKMIDHLMNSGCTITVDDFRQMAILKHRIAVASLDKELWTVHLKAGTGQLTTPESVKSNVDRRFWSMEVKKIVSSKNNSTNVDERVDEQSMCEIIVNEHLQKLNRTIEHYQYELDLMKSYLTHFTDEIEQTVETFVQQSGIQPFRMKLDYKLAVLEYDYDVQLLEREYLRHKPNENQIKVARRLCDLRYAHVQSKKELIELKQRLLCNETTELMSSMSFSVPISTIDSQLNENARQRLLNRQEKEIQAKLTDLMAASIDKAENKIHECRALFNEHILQISPKNDNKNERLPEHLVDLIYRRFDVINRKLEFTSSFRINYFLRSRYAQSKEKFNKTISDFSPTMIIDIPLHKFTDEQLKLLNRGPTYVPPCQMYIPTLSTDASISESIKKQCKLLQHNSSALFAKHGVNTALIMFINKKIKDAYTAAFAAVSLPISIYQRALYEKQLVQSIREHLKVNHLILRRTADQKNVFYLGNVEDFEELEHEYMIKTDSFEVISTIDDTNLQQTHEYLNKMIRSMNSAVDKLFTNKVFYADILKRLHVDVSKVEVPYLYFLPDVSKKDTLSVKPVIVSQRSATSRLAQVLNELLRPVIQRHSMSTTFVNGTDFIQKLNQYIEQEHHLRPTTIFVTITILNYEAMASHTTMLNTVEDFLKDHLAIPAIDYISVQTIKDLTDLFLNNNRFYYNNKIYRFTKGAPNSSLLAETLSHIYAYQWQNVLLREPLIKREFFGRFRNQIFFTWNETTNHFCQLLKTISSRDTNVQLEVKMGSDTHFLHVHIENQNGTLYSRVYHDPDAQKYTLPYVIDHVKASHSHWLRSALIRAIRYCTSVHDFNQERIYLELTCLANGYSLEFIEHRISHFFTHFDAATLRLSLDQLIYNKLRHRLFNFISEQRQYVQTNQELEKKNLLVRLTYPHQFGSKHQFNKELKETLLEYLNTHDQSLKKKMKIILTTKQQHSLNALLSRRKPSHVLLGNEKTIF